MHEKEISFICRNILKVLYVPLFTDYLFDLHKKVSNSFYI